MAGTGFVDVVDEKDNRIGQVSIEEAGKTKNGITRAVVVFVFNSNGEVFLRKQSQNKASLQKRSETKLNDPLCWTSSVLGTVGSGESYLEAAVRETREELGIKIEPYDLEFVDKLFAKTNSAHFFQVYVLYWDGIVKPNRAEINTGKFFSIQEVHKMINSGEKFTPFFEKVFELVTKEI